MTRIKELEELKKNKTTGEQSKIQTNEGKCKNMQTMELTKQSITNERKKGKKLKKKKGKTERQKKGNI